MIANTSGVARATFNMPAPSVMPVAALQSGNPPVMQRLLAWSCRVLTPLFIAHLLKRRNAAQDTGTVTGCEQRSRSLPRRMAFISCIAGTGLLLGATPVSAQTWSSASAMTGARAQHTATLLPNGKVLVAGGFNGGAYLSSAELYDLASNTWSAAPMMSATRA